MPTSPDLDHQPPAHSVPEQIARIEQALSDAGISVARFCALARINGATWWRWKQGRTPSVHTWQGVLDTLRHNCPAALSAIGEAGVPAIPDPDQPNPTHRARLDAVEARLRSAGVPIDTLCRRIGVEPRAWAMWKFMGPGPSERRLTLIERAARDLCPKPVPPRASPGSQAMADALALIDPLWPFLSGAAFATIVIAFLAALACVSGLIDVGVCP